jgi:hypothetical protein
VVGERGTWEPVLSRAVRGGELVGGWRLGLGRLAGEWVVAVSCLLIQAAAVSLVWGACPMPCDPTVTGGGLVPAESLFVPVLFVSFGAAWICVVTRGRSSVGVVQRRLLLLGY